MSLSLDIEQLYWPRYHLIAGVDEVGRGSLAGPVVAASVVFPRHHNPILGIDDSKKLPVRVRAQLATAIKKHAHFWQISFSTVSQINSQGIISALYQAMDKCLNYPDFPDLALIDGRDQPPLPSLPKSTTVHTIIKGDSICYSIAAASILAKVARDTYMKRLHHYFPHYHWHTNMGYGTTTHRQAILTHGPTRHHRNLFIKNTLNSIG